MNDIIKGFINDELVVHTYFIQSQHSDEDIAHIANTILSNYTDGKICFDVNSEGLPYNVLRAVDRVVRNLLEAGINKDNLYILSGGSECEDNHIFYKQHCQQFGLIELDIKFVEMFQIHARDKILNDIELYENNVREVSIKPKKFLSFNRTAKNNRIGLVAEILRRGLDKDAYISCYVNATEEDGCVGSCYHIYFQGLVKRFPTHYEQIIKTLNDHYHKFPMRLTLTKDNSDMDHDIGQELYLFNESYFGISTETKYFHDDYNDVESLLNDVSLNCNFFTEKTWKFVTAKQPFIVVGFTNSLKRLRELGYKTFHPYINESYDSIENDEDRLMAIADEIERLCNQTDEEWLEFQRHTNEITEHNFRVLRDLK